MPKYVLALVSLFATFQLQAQNIDRADFQEPSGGSAITIAVSKFDLEEGNSFFEDAEGLEKKGDFNEHSLYLAKRHLSITQLKTSINTARQLLK